MNWQYDFMARPLRVDIEHGIYHVVTRGIDRKPVFRVNADREHFLELMAEAHLRFRLRFFAYVLMDNHVHLVAQTPDANLSRAMQWMKVSYSMWFNAKYQRVGPLFQGRFKSVLVDPDDDWLLELSLYVHLNPVRTKLLGADKVNKKAQEKGLARPSVAQVSERMKVLREYQWSSFLFYSQRIPSPDWLDLSEIMDRLPEGQSRRQYREIAAQRISGEFDATLLDKLGGRLAIGSDDYIEMVRKLAGDGDRNVDCKKELRAHISWERLTHLAEEVRKEPWSAIRSRRGDVGRAVVFKLARRFCGMTLREIGERDHGTDYAAVSDLIRRYEKRGAPDLLEKEIVRILNLET